MLDKYTICIYTNGALNKNGKQRGKTMTMTMKNGSSKYDITERNYLMISIYNEIKTFQSTTGRKQHTPHQAIIQPNPERMKISTKMNDLKNLCDTPPFRRIIETIGELSKVGNDAKKYTIPEMHDLLDEKIKDWLDPKKPSNYIYKIFPDRHNAIVEAIVEAYIKMQNPPDIDIQEFAYNYYIDLVKKTDYEPTTFNNLFDMGV